MDAPYARVAAGALNFKGAAGSSLKKQRRKVRRQRDEETLQQPAAAREQRAGLSPAYASASGEEETPPVSAAPPKEPQILEGSGRIVATGETVQGFNTRFRQELETGDTLIIQHPSTLLPEEVHVVSIETDRTLHIKPAFTKDFISTTLYKIKKTAAAEREKAAAAAARKRRRGEETPAEGEEHDAAAAAAAALEKRLQKKSRVVSVREKTGMWGYTVKQVKLKSVPTAEELLDLRCKQGRDKFC